MPEAFFFIKRKIGSSDLIFILRRTINFMINIVLALFFIENINLITTSTTMFLANVFTSRVFLFISDLSKKDAFGLEALKFNIPTKKGVLIDFLYHIYNSEKKRNKIILFIAFFLIEPLYFIVLFREGHHKYNGFVNWKTFFIFILSCLISNTVWICILFVAKKEIGIQNLIYLLIAIMVVGAILYSNLKFLIKTPQKILVAIRELAQRRDAK
ncbi:MAG TPA: hypothetical protein PKZ36_03040 [Candidatus Paceibacterota bacterium]|nr:hypothetical protein [Candidatus Paceibacterota bacterium]HPT18355.1 hypothetical protein [Candidatus Paceibacterota bacterium]